MAKSAIATDRAPGAVGPYSQGVKGSGETVYVSGQLPLDPATGEFAGGGIKGQTRQCIENVSAILEAAGFSLDDVVKVTVFLTDMGDFGEMNEVYKEYFKEPFPARSAFQVAALPKNGPMEIEAIAMK